MTSVLDGVVLPPGWGLIPFGRLVERSREADRPDLPPLSVFLDEGVVPRTARADNFNQLGSDMAKYLVVRPGDVVFNKLRTWQGGLGVSHYKGLVSPAYFVCRPSLFVEPRFLHYLLRSAPYLAELTRVSKFMPPSQFDILWDDLRLIPVLIPPLGVQQPIADYLDHQTAHIDAVISTKRRLIELLDEKTQGLHDEWYERLSSAHGLVSIRRLAHDIEQGWSPVCDSEPADHGEWGVIQTSAVSSGQFQVKNNKRLPSTAERDTRWLLHDGDLLVTRGSGTRSKVGRACVASIGGCILTLSDLVYRVRLTQANPEFVSAALQSSPVREQLESSIRTDAGMTLKIRRDDLADVRIPAVPLEHHLSETVGLAKYLQPLQESRFRVEKQLALLAERRHALIAAVVTGETQVPETLA